MADVIESLELYSWPLVAAIVCGCLLSLIGLHVKARQEQISVLVISAGASCAYLTILLLTGFFNVDLQVFASKLCAVIVGVSLLLLLNSRKSSSLGAQMSLFIGLLCLSHLVAAANPSFEGQILRSLMGDVVLVSDESAQLLTGLAIVCGFVAFLNRKNAMRRSFAQSVFGREDKDLCQKMTLSHEMTELALLSFLCLCTVELGFLFTLVSVLLPGQMMGSIPTKLRTQFLGVTLLCIVGVVGGFLISFAYHRAPTVPAIGLLILSVGSFGIAVKALKKQPLTRS
jgi:hypothetical protein